MERIRGLMCMLEVEPALLSICKTEQTGAHPEQGWSTAAHQFVPISLYQTEFLV